MTGYRVWAQGSSAAGFVSPHFEKRERADEAMSKMRKQWGDRPKVEVKKTEWKPGDAGYFGDETTARPL